MQFKKEKKNPIVCIDSWQSEASFIAFALRRSRLYVKKKPNSQRKNGLGTLFGNITHPTVQVLPFIIRISGADSWRYTCVCVFRRTSLIEVVKDFEMRVQ